jgi:hypothetical protein
MNMSIRFLFLLFILFLCSFACSKKGDEYLPLSKVGQSTEGALKLITVNGVEYEGKQISRVENEETLNGKKYFKTVTTVTGDLQKILSRLGGRTEFTSYERRTDEALYLVDDDKHKDIPEYIYFPIPLEIGKKWTAQTPYGIESSEVETIETVELSSGKYENCLKVHRIRGIGNERVESFDYLAPNIGLIKNEVKGQLFTVQYFYERRTP